MLSLPADGSSAGAAAAVSTPVSSTDAAGLMELDNDTFQAYIEAAGDTLVVVDFFTDVSILLRTSCLHHLPKLLCQPLGTTCTGLWSVCCRVAAADKLVVVDFFTGVS
jgi:hypothetical protein